MIETKVFAMMIVWRSVRAESYIDKFNNVSEGSFNGLKEFTMLRTIF